MIEMILAFAASFLLGISAVSIRKHIESSSFLSVSLITTIIGSALFFPVAVYLVLTTQISLYGILFFLLAGILHPGLFRIFYFKGMEEIGVCRNSVLNATYPWFSAATSILLLGESVTSWTVAGLILILVGPAIVQMKASEDSSTTPIGWKMAFPLSAAFVYGLAFTIRKLGLHLLNEPLLGVSLGYFSAISFFAVLLFSSSNARRSAKLSKSGFKLFWKSGVCICVALLFSLYALANGEVTVVTSILQTESLFILAFTYTFLKRVEAVSFWLVFGALTVVSGVTLIILAH